jgi:hypothetical protein
MGRARKQPEAPPAAQPALPWQTGPDGMRVYVEPDGPPAVNPLTAEHYAALMQVLDRIRLLADSIPRAAHIGLNVDAHAAQTESHYVVAQRILAKYPPPAKHPLES